MDWRKSSYSNANGRSCAEVASDGTILVRDTTNLDGGTLAFTTSAWQEFIASLR
jgi:Domain of unknown function (DUF397)